MVLSAGDEKDPLEPRWENPYKKRVAEFPERIFSINSDAERAAAVSMLGGQTQPIVLEIGSGSGNHLIEAARRCPDTMFVGVEVRYKRAVRTIEKALASGVDNVRVLRGPVQHIAPLLETDAAIAGCYVNFPDPWPKRRSEKKRLLTNGLMDSVQAWLSPGGFLSIKTDQHDYFEAFCLEVQDRPAFELLRETRDLYSSPYLEDNIASEFECLFSGKGQPICYALLKRV